MKTLKKSNYQFLPVFTITGVLFRHCIVSLLLLEFCLVYLFILSSYLTTFVIKPIKIKFIQEQKSP